MCERRAQAESQRHCSEPSDTMRRELNRRLCRDVEVVQVENKAARFLEGHIRSGAASRGKRGTELAIDFREFQFHDCPLGQQSCPKFVRPLERH
jgi:hypothetical protein